MRKEGRRREEGGRKGGKEGGGREDGREGGRREARREGGREGGRRVEGWEGGREVRIIIPHSRHSLTWLWYNNKVNWHLTQSVH